MTKTSAAVFIETIFRTANTARDEREVEQRRERELREHREQPRARVRQHERRPDRESQSDVSGPALAPSPFGDEQAEQESERHLREVCEVIAVDKLRVAADVFRE